jgi:hypothetical protein
MPKVFAWNGYRFHFFANEGDPREPPHVHTTKGSGSARRFPSPTIAAFRPECFQNSTVL